MTLPSPPDTPATPPVTIAARKTGVAATLILARDGERGVEIFLMQRTLAAKFMPGVYVFPGGGVDAADRALPHDLGQGLADDEASRLLGVPEGGLAYWIAAIRECYEEAGFLFAADESGELVRLADDGAEMNAADAGTDISTPVTADSPPGSRADPVTGLPAQSASHPVANPVLISAAIRRQVASGELSLEQLCRQRGLRLALDRLVYFAHWLTPADLPRRFDTRFFIAAAPHHQTGSHDDAETIAHCWIRPADALAQHRDGRMALAFVTSRVLASLVQFDDVAGLLAFARSQSARGAIAQQLPQAARGRNGREVLIQGDAAYAEIGRLDPEGAGRAASFIEPGRVVRLAPHVHRVTADNPGMMTGPGTNSYLLDFDPGASGDTDGGASAGDGRERGVVVIDPGPADEEHLTRLIDAAGELAATVRAILVTHTHPDHSPGAALLKARTGAPVYGMAAPAHGNQDGDFCADRELRDGEILDFGDLALQVVHTPGHASNHLCYFLASEKMLFTGDQIMQGSTVVINPPDGDMRLYLDSLARLKRLEPQWLAPGHGFLMDRPAERIDRLVAHRMAREEKILAALAQAGPRGQTTLEALVAVAYDDVPAARHAVAQRSLLAHLQKLQAEGRVCRDGPQWLALPAGRPVSGATPSIAVVSAAPPTETIVVNAPASGFISPE